MAKRDLKTAHSAEDLCREREQRVMDAIRLKIPDRVPVISGMGYFPAKYTGITCDAAWYDYDKWLAAYKKTLPDFQPDMIFQQGFTPGRALEYLKPRTSRWPGYGVSPHGSHQAIEIEILKENEYDLFLNDPGDYFLRLNLGRICEETAGLESLPKLNDLGYSLFGAHALADALVKPEVARAIKALQKYGREMNRWRSRIFKFHRMVEDFGFPPFTTGFAMTAFDGISHSMRGLKGTITDMYRQPDKLLETCQRILAMDMKKPVGFPSKLGYIRVFIPLTRGSDNFMSLKQFEKFYWPTLKKLLLHLIEQGAYPCCFFEGNFDTRLEYLLDLPKGKICAYLDTSDIFRAKEILKGHCCIKGNIPTSILQYGSVQDVKDCCKKLIDVVGKDGGYILSPRGSTDEVKAENLKAMIEFTKEYGVYR
ncbi:MAG: hypothetical protein JXA46_08760 [Dehalococcoidales bacterium]|nr:hypothetical protein [Dehalococcoidales bacterium]